MASKIRIIGSNLQELIPILSEMGYIFEGCANPFVSNRCNSINEIGLNFPVIGRCHIVCDSIQYITDVTLNYPEELDIIREIAELKPTIKEINQFVYNGQLFKDGDKVNFRYENSHIENAKIRIWRINSNSIRFYLLTNISEMNGDEVPDGDRMGYVCSYSLTFEGGRLLDGKITNLFKTEVESAINDGKIIITIGKRKGEKIDVEDSILLWDGNVVHNSTPVKSFTKGIFNGKFYDPTITSFYAIKDGFVVSPSDSLITIRSTNEKILASEKRQYKVSEDYNGGNWEYQSKMVYGFVSSSNEGFFKKNEGTIYSSYSDTYFISKNTALRRNYDFCEDSNDWLPSELIQKTIWDYHHGERSTKTNSNTKFTVGFEIEKEDREVRNREKANKIFSKTGWSKEKDGSLNQETGFELISPVFDLFETDRILKSFDSVKDYINAKYSANCGGHINFAIVELDDTKEMFNKVNGYLPLLYSMYENRMKTRYCQAKKKSDMLYGDKYQAIALKDGRIEIRIFSAVRNVKQLEWRLKFMQIIANNLTNSTIKVLKMAINPEHDLHKHLLEVYNLPMLKNRIYRALEHYQHIEQVAISTKTKERFNKLTEGKSTDINVDLDNIFNEIIEIQSANGGSIIEEAFDQSLGTTLTWSSSTIINPPLGRYDSDFEEIPPPISSEEDDEVAF